MQGKLKRIGEALLNSKDHRSVKKDQVEDGDEKAAWDRLENLQNSKSESHAPTGYADQGQHSHPSSNATGGAVPDPYNQAHVEHATNLHHVAENTALRPESQEIALGDGTAGDDLAI
ncbi:MAG: hypothetical protein CYPHOPRED_001277 [Cyphobasidiales sp. Tagirdzhanova-0007]|nr:MAG: hypothetical protein CYPHOPRED_001277 [Cyphobasidiales sp. Tagirdzhanova-0007]